jgi:hypothetical protein
VLVGSDEQRCRLWNSVQSRLDDELRSTLRSSPRLLKSRLLSGYWGMHIGKLVALFFIIPIQHGADIFNSCQRQHDGRAGYADEKHAFQDSD